MRSKGNLLLKHFLLLIYIFSIQYIIKWYKIMQHQMDCKNNKCYMEFEPITPGQMIYVCCSTGDDHKL